MPIPSEDGQPDVRAPGFGCGISFGMLGPTRVVLSSGTLPPILAPYALVCLPWESQYDEPGFTIINWHGHWSDGTDIYLGLSLVNKLTGEWQMTAEYYTGIPTTSRIDWLTRTNFTWSMEPNIMGGHNPHGFSATCYRLREWESIYDRFPGCVIPDIA